MKLFFIRTIILETEPLFWQKRGTSSEKTETGFSIKIVSKTLISLIPRSFSVLLLQSVRNVH